MNVLNVILAANSSLYTPILLAKAAKINETCKEMKLVLAKSKREPKDVDPFIDCVLSQADNRERMLVGIGDPMRITALNKTTSRYSEPRVIGNLINKMCYWLIDGRDHGSSSLEWESVFAKVFVPPKGMTGFTVPCHDYKVRTGKDPKHITDVLCARLDPNNERALYEKLHTELKANNLTVKKPFAFITTNPLHVFHGQKSTLPYEVVHYFPDNKDAFCNVVMTGLIIAKDRPRSSQKAFDKAIKEFREGVRLAIAYIKYDYRLAAYTLFKSFGDEKFILDRDQNSVHPFVGSLPELIAIINTISAYEIYTEDLSLTKSQWEKTKIIRQSVEPLLGEREKKRSAATLSDEYCYFSD